MESSENTVVSVKMKSPSRRSSASVSGSFSLASVSHKSLKAVAIQDKLEEINQQLAEVRKQKQELEKPVKRKSIKLEKKGSKNSFHHPKLDYVMAEVVYSPYMTKPNEKYSEDTLKVPEKLRELKKLGSKLKDIPPELQPFDVEKVKEKFIEDVVKYTVSYINTDEKSTGGVRKSLSSRQSVHGVSSTRNSSLLPRVNSKGSNVHHNPQKQERSPTFEENEHLPKLSGINQEIKHAIFHVKESFAEHIDEMAKKEIEREKRSSKLQSDLQITDNSNDKHESEEKQNKESTNDLHPIKTTEESKVDQPLSNQNQEQFDNHDHQEHKDSQEHKDHQEHKNQNDHQDTLLSPDNHDEQPDHLDQPSTSELSKSHFPLDFSPDQMEFDPYATEHDFEPLQPLLEKSEEERGQPNEVEVYADDFGENIDENVITNSNKNDNYAKNNTNDDNHTYDDDFVDQDIKKPNINDINTNDPQIYEEDFS